MIDAVITWVDGDDPQHAAKRALYQNDKIPASSLDPTRFAHRGEIKYCIWSIIKFCPFIRQIFVVTDNQKPDDLDVILNSAPQWRERIKIIDHDELFEGMEELLPVFSSRSIETLLYRIPDLAENFIYLNDDMFIGRPLEPEFFFRDEKPVLQGRLKTLPKSWLVGFKSFLKGKQRRAGFNDAQREGAIAAGRTKTFILAEHHPHALRKSTFSTFFERQPSLLRRQVRHRFRSTEQFSPIGLANNLEFSGGAVVAMPKEVGYVKPALSRRVSVRNNSAVEAFREGRLSAICVQSLDQIEKHEREAIIASLEQWFHGL